MRPTTCPTENRARPRPRPRPRPRLGHGHGHGHGHRHGSATATATATATARPRQRPRLGNGHGHGSATARPRPRLGHGQSHCLRSNLRWPIFFIWTDTGSPSPRAGPAAHITNGPRTNRASGPANRPVNREPNRVRIVLVEPCHTHRPARTGSMVKNEPVPNPTS